MNPYVSVSDLVETIKYNLECSFPSVSVEGEITNIPASSSQGRYRNAHWYFSLKDTDPARSSQINCVLFAQYLQYLNFYPENGLKVIATGKVSVYDKSGRMQLIITSMQMAGRGALELRFRQLEEKLRNEGLFDSALKRPIPPFPLNIGIITSSSGLAVNDIITKIHGNHYPGTIIIYPALVQGLDAPQSLIDQLNAANSDGICDVIIIGRGGGSYEDLFCFNDENLVRTLRHSAIPVISAIGHTEDESLCDYAADYHATTPTDAGVYVARNYAASYQQMPEISNWFMQRILNIFQKHNHGLKFLENQLFNSSPQRYITLQQEKISVACDALERTIIHHLEKIKNDLELSSQVLSRYHPDNRIQSLKERLEFLTTLLINRMESYMEKTNNTLQSKKDSLFAFTPERRIEANYYHLNNRRQHLKDLISRMLEAKNRELSETSVSFSNLNPLISPRFMKTITEKDDKVISSVKELQKGDVITTRMKDGKVVSVVSETCPVNPVKIQDKKPPRKKQ